MAKKEVSQDVINKRKETRSVNDKLRSENSHLRAELSRARVSNNVEIEQLKKDNATLLAVIAKLVGTAGMVALVLWGFGVI